MTSLPISSNQPSGNAVKALQANAITDDSSDIQSAEPFAFLLAQQICEAGLSAQCDRKNALPLDGSIMDSSTDLSMMDAQDQQAANLSDAPENMLTAIMMQLPAPESRGQKLGNDKQATQPLAISPYQEPNNNKPAIDMEEAQATQLPETGLHPSEASKRADWVSVPAQPTSNPAQAVASAQMLSTTPGVPTNSFLPTGTAPAIATPLGSQGWADEFSQKISWISNQQSQVAELRLNPPNLGPLDVVLKISDGQATALFASPHGTVREAVENALPKLREILADNGIMLGNTTISDQPRHERSMDEFTGRGFGAATQHESADAVPGTTDPSAVATQTTAASRHNGMVDTFA